MGAIFSHKKRGGSLPLPLLNPPLQVLYNFLACDAFVRTNRRVIAMMFICLSVCLSGTSVHCDYTVHFKFTVG